MVVSFGFFEGAPDEPREAQGALGRTSQLAAIEPYVDDVLLDGSFEVVEELT